MIIKAKILQVEPQKSSDLVTYQFIEDTGNIIGPKMEHRPKDEDHQAFIDSMIEAESAVPVILTKEQQFAESFSLFDDQTIKNVLQIDDITLSGFKLKVIASKTPIVP